MENGNHLDAIRALRNRGVDQAEPLLETATPNEILSTCHRFDARQGRVGPGWLVTEIRAGHYTDPDDTPSVADRLQAQFTEHQRRLPADTIIDRCAHTDCTGWMRVQPSTYPILVVACSVCRAQDGYPIRALPTLHPLRDQPDPNLPF